MGTPVLEELNGEVVSQKCFDSGYAILRLEISKGSVAVLVGEMPQLAEGVMIRAFAEKTEHPKYGQQYKISSLEETGFSSTDGVINYLSGPAFEGIGKAAARMVADHLGADALSILDETPERIFEVPGLSTAKAQIIIECWKADRKQHKLISELMKYGVTLNFAMKIFQHFGERSSEVVQKEPYSLTQVHGMGFHKADEVALKVGTPRNSEARVEAAIKYCMEAALMQGGNCYMSHKFIAEEAVKLLLGDINILQVAASIKTMTAKNILTVIENKIYLTSIYVAEQQVVEHLSAMINYQGGRKIYNTVEDLDQDLDKLGINQEITLAPEQKLSLFTAVNNRVCILTGSPGTGKSTLTRALCQLMDLHNIKFNLCSPTGRAAKRLMECTGRTATTIHRLLKVAHDGSGFEFNIDNPLPTDCVVIDEVSMLDVLLFRHVLAAMESNDRLILVGDADQLPSVGPGNVLRDMIKSEKIPVVRLQRIFRQGAKSAIVVAAKEVIQGQMPELLVPSQAKGKNFMFAGAEKMEDVIKIIIHLVTKTLPNIKINDKNLTSEDIQVITPMREKGLGINDLNPRLQDVLNPQDGTKEEIQAGMLTGGPRIFRVGDRVMQNKNDYEKDVFNGNLGIIVGINKNISPAQVVVQFQDMNGVTIYKPHELDTLQHSWAMTYHKTQGGEFPAAIVVCHDSHSNMLQRNLLYTGITRAKNICIVVGTESAVQTAVNNSKEQSRNTTIMEMLQKGK